MISLEDLRDKLFNAPYGSDLALDLLEQIEDTYGPVASEGAADDYYEYLFPENGKEKMLCFPYRPWEGPVQDDCDIDDNYYEVRKGYY